MRALSAHRQANAGNGLRIAHVGTFDVANYGDLLFPLVLRRRLAGIVSELVALSPTGGPPVFSDCVASRPIDVLDDARLELDGVVVGGGNILHASPWNRELYDIGGLSGITAYPRIWLGAADAAARRGIPLVWNAVGVPRPFAEEAARIAVWAASVCDYASVRDRASARYLERAGFADSVTIVPDTALDVRELWSPAELDDAYEAIFATRGLAVPERVVAVHLNARYAPRSPARTAAAVDALCRRADAVPLLLALGPCHGDDEFARETGRRLKTAVVVDRPSSLRELTAAIARSDAYLGSSLHGMICACAFGVRGAVVASERNARLRKFSGFLEQVGLERWLVESWPKAERCIDELFAEPIETWARVHALARPALDRHWTAVAAALANNGGDGGVRAQSGRKALRHLSELSAGASATSALYGTIVPEILRSLVAELVARDTQRGRTKRRHVAAAQQALVQALETELRSRLTRGEESTRELSGKLRAVSDEAERLRDALAETEATLTATRTQRNEARAQLHERAAAEEIALEAARRDRATATARAAALAEDLRSARAAGADTAAEAERVDHLLVSVRETVDLLEDDLEKGRAKLIPRRAARLRTELDEAAGMTRRLASAGFERRPRVTRPGRRDRRPKVMVISWDMGHNPLGRAALLADVLRGPFDVEVVGAQFERYGSEIWKPFQHSPIPMRTFPGRSFPDHFAAMEDVARGIDADVVYVSKPRLPSLALGALAKEHRNRPLLLDVDDRELSFFGETEGLALAELEHHRDDPDLLLPFSRLWTRACETLIGSADHVTVSNPTLARLYGGTIFPHARDETVFDPARYDRRAARRRFGLPEDVRLILFAGTPRRHKGVLELARALDQIGNATYRLCLFATPELRELERDLAPYARWVETLPPVPFTELPEVLAMADLVCVLQDPQSEIARYQIPAKVTDALAMGVPCLATNVPPLEPLVAAGAVAPLDGVSLEEHIETLLADPVSASELAARGRETFLAELSYGAVRPRVERVIHELAEATPPLSLGLGDLLRVQRSSFGAPDPPAVKHPPVPPRLHRLPPRHPTDDHYDVVVFWKQNDTGIYGRRQDMLVRALAASDRVGRIAHFDEPLDLEALRELRSADGGQGVHQARLVARQTVRRVLRIGGRDGKVVHRTFLHRSSGSQVGRLERMLPNRDAYPAWVASCLAQDGIGRRTTVFWVYPRNFDFVPLVEAVEPDLVLADVVDDHRAWLDPSSPYHEKITRNYEEILRAADVVLANCEPVQRAMNVLHQPVQLVPNASEYPVHGTGRARRPRELRRFEGPIVGYAGNLSSRIDIELLDAVARRRPDWNLVFIGSAHLSRDILRLDEHANVHFLGVRPYEEAKRFIRAFDVGIIPHLDNEITRSMNPLKAFVYLAENVPVVSTEIANLGPLEELVSLSSGPDEFVHAVDAALRCPKPRSLPKQQARILAENSWSARVEQILGFLDDARLTRRAA